MSITFVTLADEKYLHYLRALLNSSRVNLPEVKWHIVLVNVSDTVLQEFKSLYSSQYEFVIDNKQFYNKAQLKCYCTNRRGYLLLELRKNTKDILVWLDADSIIRKPLSHLANILPTADVILKPKCKYDIKKGKPTGFMGGIIGLNNTNKALEFAEKYNNFMPANLWKEVPKTFNTWGDISGLPKKVKRIWMANQNILNRVYKESVDTTFLKLTNEYLDTTYRDESFIWSIKASTRGNQTFKKEYKFYFTGSI